MRLAMRDSFVSSLTAATKKMVAGLHENQTVTSFIYEDYGLDSVAGVEYDIELENELNKSGRFGATYIYPLGDNTGMIAAMLIYPKEHRKEAERAWDDLRLSFRHGDEYTQAE